MYVYFYKLVYVLIRIIEKYIFINWIRIIYVCILIKILYIYIYGIDIIVFLNKMFKVF